MFYVDAKGLVCPRPVIMAKKALESNDEICIHVDNETSAQNLEKMASVMALTFDCQTKDGVYEITLKKTGETRTQAEDDDDYIVVVSSKFAGQGDDTLGEALMKSFIYTLTEAEKLPATMIFYNGGVWLTTEGSPVIEDIKKLESAGVEILSCGTCLNFYGLTEKLRAGGVTNMYVIAEKQMKAKRIVRP